MSNFNSSNNLAPSQIGNAGIHSHPELGKGSTLFMHTTENTGLVMHGVNHQVMGNNLGNRKEQLNKRFGA